MFGKMTLQMVSVDSSFVNAAHISRKCFELFYQPSQSGIIVYNDEFLSRTHFLPLINCDVDLIC